MKITVIGCGRWGAFLAWYLYSIGNEVKIYGRSDSRTYQNLKATLKNEYLTLSPEITFTDNLKEAVETADRTVISIGTQNYPQLAKSIKDCGVSMKNREVILCMKGIIKEGGKRLSEATAEILGNHTQCAVWVGPGHVEDFIRGIPNCMLICSEDQQYARRLCSDFGSQLIRFYYSRDMIGCEIGAASKNVMGIAAGMLDGMGYSSLKGALMARGPREIARLTKAMGGDERSIFGLCHIGDYEATLFSEHSHNRKYGEAFIKGEKYEKLAEGVETVKSVLYLGDKYGVELPICSAVNAVIHEKKDASKVCTELFLREQKSEF